MYNIPFEKLVHLNTLYSLGHFALGSAIAFTVNKVAHRLFNIQDDSQSSYVARTIAISAGTISSIYFAPKTPLFAVTGEYAGVIIATAIGISVVAKKICNDDLFVTLTIAMAVYSWGPAVGFAGRFSLISCGALGAAIGTVLRS